MIGAKALFYLTTQDREVRLSRHLPQVEAVGSNPAPAIGG